MQLSKQSNDCWSVHILCVMDGLTQSYIFKQKLQNCEPIDLSAILSQTSGRHLEYWTPHSQTHPREHYSKRSTYHQWCSALPTRRALVTHLPYILPKYIFLNLPRDVIRSAARFKLCVHTICFETATWSIIINSIAAEQRQIIFIISSVSSPGKFNRVRIGLG